MADKGPGLSKAAKKNLKKNARKKAAKSGTGKSGNSEETTHAELLSLLKVELENAKAKKDHALCGKLREQVWVLTDIIAGVKTDLPEEDLLPIINNIHEVLGIHQKSSQPPPEATPPETMGMTSSERKLRNLRKKIDQIVQLKAKKAAGEKLEQTQLDKINAEAQLEEDINELEDLIHQAMQLKRT